MKYQRNKFDPVKTLIFIMIGAVLIVFTDLFIFNEARYKWWEEDITQTSDMPIDIVRLRKQNEQYLKNGIDIPDTVAVDYALPAPLNINDYKFAEINLSKTAELTDIEPSVGVEKNIEPEQKNSAGIKPENIEHIILNLDHSTKSITEEIIPDQKHKPSQKPYVYEEPDKAGKIAIIIDDMGLTLRSKLVENMPAPLTLSYLPYAKNLKERTKRAAENGHELMVHVPMEPLNSTLDTGPHVLKSEHSKKELLKNLEWNLSQFGGFVGINNHMGSRITRNRTAMTYVMTELKNRNLYFIDSRTISTSVAAQVAQEKGLAFGKRDVFLDHEISPSFIHGALKKLEKKAYEQGYAIAIGHPHKETIEALKEWIPTLKKKGLKLVPVSEVLHKPNNTILEVKANVP